jgi:translation initiation factor 1
MTRKRPEPPAAAGAAPPPNNPFGSLSNLRDQLPAGQAPAVPTEKPPPPGPARAVVRYERKGRKGKEVTVVDKLGLREADLEAWTRALKQALGVGGSVEDDTIVLQGDCRARLPALLTARGVRKVTVS